MRNAEEITKLVKLTLINRVFVMCVLERVEVELEKYLYNFSSDSCEGVKSGKAICINMEEILYSAFVTEKINGEKVIVGWNEKVKKFHPNLQVPEAFYRKTWKKICRDALFTDFSRHIDDFLKAKGFLVNRNMSDLKKCYIEIAWEKTTEEKNEETTAKSSVETQVKSTAETSTKALNEND